MKEELALAAATGSAILVVDGAQAAAVAIPVREEQAVGTGAAMLQQMLGAAVGVASLAAEDPTAAVGGTAVQQVDTSHSEQSCNPSMIGGQHLQAHCSPTCLQPQH